MSLIWNLPMSLKKGSSTLKKNIIAKILKAAVGIAAVCGIGYGIYWALSEDIEVRCLKVAASEYTDSFTENAYVKSGDTVNCVSETEGAVISVNVKKNQSVKKGDVIAVISSKDLEFEKMITATRMINSAIMGTRTLISCTLILPVPPPFPFVLFILLPPFFVFFNRPPLSLT